MAAGERAVAASLGRFFPSDPRRVLVPIGDDAALVRSPSRSQLLACDPVIEGVHFEPGASRFLVGRKAVARNLSDIAAMGGTPDFLLVAALLPAGFSSRDRAALFRGIRTEADAHGCLVVGGDLSRTPGPLTVVVTVVGHPGKRVLTRSGAGVGDALHVTGPLGGSFESGRHMRIAPRLDEGRWLSGRREVTAAMDISDGLLLDLKTLLDASGVPGAELDAASIPVHRTARRLAGGDAERARAHALRDGEDHELLFTVRRGAALGAGGPLSDRSRRPIGTLVARPGLWLRALDGSLRSLRVEGYEHDVR
jgi:thiamine-monophosphate kinase